MTSINLVKNFHNINIDSKYKTKNQHKKIISLSFKSIEIYELYIKKLEKTPQTPFRTL